MMHHAKAPDLSATPPRSPRDRIGGYAIIARTIDKGRAKENGNLGEYHYDCPLDNMLFKFAGVDGASFLEQIRKGCSDREMAEWVSENGSSHSKEEIERWSDEMEGVSLYGDPEMGDFFKGECERLGLDAAKVTLFEMLEADDRASFDLSPK